MQELKGVCPVQETKRKVDFSKFRLPTLTVVALAATLVGCSPPMRPRIDVDLDSNASGPSVQLAANRTASGGHFNIDSLNARFSQPGTYIISDPVARQKWSVNVQGTNVGQTFTLRYDKSRFLCMDLREGNNTSLTVVRSVLGQEPQVGFGAFRLVPP
jgi:hypothetical protein